MEMLSRFAIYLGIGIAVTIFALFLVAVLPSILENSDRDWERLDRGNHSEEELHAKLAGHPAYKAMYERFPDAKEDFSLNEYSGYMAVGVMNFESNAQLILNLNYYDHEDKIHADVRCETESGRDGLHVDDLFVEDFIRNTDCLEWVTDRFHEVTP